MQQLNTPPLQNICPHFLCSWYSEICLSFDLALKTSRFYSLTVSLSHGFIEIRRLINETMKQ